MTSTSNMASINTASSLSLSVITWNLADITPELSGIEALFLPQPGVASLGTSSDLLIIGLQEAPHAIAAVVSGDHLVDLFANYLAPKGFVCANFNRMSITPGLWGLLTMVFVKAPLLCYIRDVDTLVTRTGVGGLVGNKGASTVRLTLGRTTLCFVNCHLIPHTENNSKRVLEVKHIMESQYFEHSVTSHFTLGTHMLGHDLVFFFGDLNFRLEGMTFDEIHRVLTEGSESDINELLKLDQLQLEQEKGTSSESHLHYFMEAPITFQPSFKFEPNTDEYSKSRSPAWCDRILWRVHKKCLPKANDPNPVNLLTHMDYNLHKLPRISDHKAVSATFQLNTSLEALVPNVIFHLSEWQIGYDTYVMFDVMKGTMISFLPWDWIGLYPQNFSHIQKDYITYVYSPVRHGRLNQKQTFKVRMPGSTLPKSPGFYRLAYISRSQNCVLGMSPLFFIRSYED